MGFEWEEAEHDAVVFGVAQEIRSRYPQLKVHLNPSFNPSNTKLSGCCPDVLALSSDHRTDQTSSPKQSLIFEVAARSAFREFREKTKKKLRRYCQLEGEITLLVNELDIGNAHQMLNQLCIANVHVGSYHVNPVSDGFEVAIEGWDNSVKQQVPTWDYLVKHSSCAI